MDSPASDNRTFGVIGKVSFFCDYQDDTYDTLMGHSRLSRLSRYYRYCRYCRYCTVGEPALIWPCPKHPTASVWRHWPDDITEKLVNIILLHTPEVVRESFTSLGGNRVGIIKGFTNAGRSPLGSGTRERLHVWCERAQANAYQQAHKLLPTSRHKIIISLKTYRSHFRHFRRISITLARPSLVGLKWTVI